MTYRDDRRTSRAETIRRKQIRSVKYQTTETMTPAATTRNRGLIR